MSLFDGKKVAVPLADRVRPSSLDEFIGQSELVGESAPLRKIIEKNEIPSMIFWGPPGSGKTTLARIIGKSEKYRFINFSAVLCGVKEVRQIIGDAKLYNAQSRKTILFIDEIHRFNKAQQDIFLPHVEDGTIILIGSTTENPSFEVISPLLSRVNVYVFKPLCKGDVKKIIERAISVENGLRNVEIGDEGKEYIAQLSYGDARISLNVLELISNMSSGKSGKIVITVEDIQKGIKAQPLLYDKKGEYHYNLISAFIKSLRGSDADASVYWLARMIDCGESPLFIVRRMVIFAAEDIGNADPQGLVIASACKSAVELVGLPEGYLPLAQTAIYLARAAKSNSVLTAYNKALEDVKKFGPLPVPLHLRNPETFLMKSLGYGENYKYPHNYDGNWVEEDYLPEELKGRKYWVPSGGYEQKMNEKKVD